MVIVIMMFTNHQWTTIFQDCAVSRLIKNHDSVQLNVTNNRLLKAL